MRGVHVAYALIIAALLLIIIGVFALSGGSHDCLPKQPAMPLPRELSSLLDRLNRLNPGESFELRGTSAEWNAWLDAHIADRPRAPIAGVALTFQRDTVLLDICVRGILLFPIRVHLALTITPAEGSLHVACRDMVIGHVPMPTRVRTLCTRRLNNVWEQPGRAWTIERVELRDDLLLIAGRRR